MSYPVQTQVSIWIKPDALPPEHRRFIAISQFNVKRIRIQTRLSPETTSDWKARKKNMEELPTECLKNWPDIQHIWEWAEACFTVSLGLYKLPFVRQNRCIKIYEVKDCEREADLLQYNINLLWPLS